jgi:hypothetical protein
MSKVRIMANHALPILILGMIPVSAYCEPAPDPVTLLSGVEESRRAIKSGVMTMLFNYRYPGPGATRRSARLRVMYLDDKFRYETINDDKRRLLSVFDGNQALYYDSERKNADITKLEDYTGLFLFDPRNLGLTTKYFAHYTLDICLGYKKCKDIQALETETIRGVLTWHVRVIDAYDQKLDFWVEPKHPYKVLRHSYKSTSRDYVTECEYSDEYKPQSCIPRKVITKDRMSTEGIGELYDMEILEVETNIPVDPSNFLLEGLGLSFGTVLNDLRIQQRIGYWTGTHLSEHPTREPRRDGDKGTVSIRSYFLYFNAAVISVIVVYCIKRYLYWKKQPAEK